MELNVMIENKFLQYLCNEISKENLRKWAIDVLHSMLKGDIFKITYLEIWGMISELTAIDDMDDFYCDELVRRFNRILSGKENASFTFAFQIPKKFVINDLLQIEDIFNKYLKGKQLSETEISELKRIVQKSQNEFNTLNELLKLQIIDLINLGYEFSDDENRIEFNLKSTVFISEEKSISLKNDFIAKIIMLLECYNGRRCFYIHITFNNGIRNISIQV